MSIDTWDEIRTAYLVARLGTLAQQQLRPLPLQQTAKVQPGQLAAALVQRFSPAEPTANKS